MSKLSEITEVPEVDIEVGFLIGCTSCSLETDDEDDLDREVEQTEPAGATE
jgi:hypothetical protein